MLPNGFCTIDDKRIIKQMDYTTSHNFIGRPVAGYLAPVCILTHAAADTLLKVQEELDSLKKGYRLKIFDAYRPTSAVADFIHWSKDPVDQKMKSIFYPALEKGELFDLGYIAKKSTHSRGSTVDLTITVASNPNAPPIDLEMGTIFDFFDESTHTAFSNISPIAKKNRAFLKDIMERHGFINYPLEWWHFTLENEPFPDTYFDFLVDEHPPNAF